MERSKLVDDFRVCSGKGDGVIARVKRGGNIPEERRTVRVADEGEEEVGAAGGAVVLVALDVRLEVGEDGDLAKASVGSEP